jgi:hypothetical protein
MIGRAPQRKSKPVVTFASNDNKRFVAPQAPKKRSGRYAFWQTQLFFVILGIGLRSRTSKKQGRGHPRPCFMELLGDYNPYGTTWA